MTYELGPLQHVNLECPFCKKEAVKAIYHPPILQAKTSRISAGAKTRFYRTRERYEITSGCSSCDKTKKEIQKALKEGVKKDHRKRVEELAKAGFPMKITTEVRK